MGIYQLSFYEMQTVENIQILCDIERQAAKAGGAHQTILQNKNSIKLIIKNFKGKYEYDAPLNGTEIKYTDSDKDEVVSKSAWNEERTAIIELMTKGKDKKEYTTKRYMDQVNDEMRQEIKNKNGKYCI